MASPSHPLPLILLMLLPLTLLAPAAAQPFYPPQWWWKPPPAATWQHGPAPAQQGAATPPQPAAPAALSGEPPGVHEIRFPPADWNATGHQPTGAASAPPPAGDGAADAGASNVLSEEDGDPLSTPPLSLYQAHGWLMVLAYAVLMPVAVMAARFTQTLSEHWYTVHWTLQVASVSMVLPGFVISVAYFNALHTKHAQLGIAVAAITFAQPLVAALRPPRGMRGRMAWYLLHWFLGNAAIILAWYNCFSGLRLYDAISPGSHVNAFRVALMVYLGVLIFVFLFLSRWDHIKDQELSERLNQGVVRRAADFGPKLDPQVKGAEKIPYKKQTV